MDMENQLKNLRDIWPHLNKCQRKWLRFQGEFFYVLANVLDFLYRVDLWLFPPLAFIGNYFAMLKLFPPHPMKYIAILASSFMSATLTLFILHPPKRLQYHWVN